jgi:hypothetical protein
VRFVFAAQQAEPRQPAPKCWAYVTISR